MSFYSVTGLPTGIIGELSVDVPSDYWQDINTAPGTYQFQLFYAGYPGGLNQMDVRVGPPGAEATVLSLATTSSAMQFHAGTIEIPCGQSVTRFLLKSRKSPIAYNGNEVAGIQFCAASAPTNCNPPSLCDQSDLQYVVPGSSVTTPLPLVEYSNPQVDFSSLFLLLGQGPYHGSVQCNPASFGPGTCTYTPDAGYLGADEYAWSYMSTSSKETASTEVCAALVTLSVQFPRAPDCSDTSVYARPLVTDASPVPVAWDVICAGGFPPYRVLTSIAVQPDQGSVSLNATNGT